MFKLSDIFKKNKDNKKKIEEESLILPIKEQNTPKETMGQNTNPSEDKGKFSIASVVHKDVQAADSAVVNGIYDEAIFCAKKVYRVDLDFEPNLMGVVSVVIDKIVDILTTGNKNLLRLCLTDFSNTQDFLYYHAVNVCIISIELGLGLGYERLRLKELGLSAFVHDIGVIKYLDIINKSEVLKNDDFSKVKQHPNTGLEILTRIGKELNHNIFDVVKQEHERIDGTGYPQGLKDNEICEYARIVGLVDVYEAMVHRRPHREKHTSLETIKEILAKKSTFDSKVIKVLIEKIGIFPMGTMVKLNTKEVGMVVKENPDLPLRPTVNLMFDAYGKEVKEPRLINLSESSMIYIEECLKN